LGGKEVLLTIGESERGGAVHALDLLVGHLFSSWFTARSGRTRAILRSENVGPIVSVRARVDPRRPLDAAVLFQCIGNDVVHVIGVARAQLERARATVF